MGNFQSTTASWTQPLSRNFLTIENIGGIGGGIEGS